MPEKQITANGRTLTIGNWGIVSGLRHKIIYDRLRNGWPPEQAVGIKPRVKDGVRTRPNRLTEFHPVEFFKTVIVKPDKAAIGKAVRKIRLMAGKTTIQTAEAMGLKHKTFVALERGKCKWTEERLDKFNEVARSWVNGNDDRNTINDSAGNQRTESV